MKPTESYFKLLLILIVFSFIATGCLERRLFLTWRANKDPKLAYFLSGDSTDVMTGTLPVYEHGWKSTPPRHKDDDKAGSFSQTGKWTDALLGKTIEPSDASPITPKFELKRYFVGIGFLRKLEGTVPGASFYPFENPEGRMPENPVDSLKKAGVPLTAGTQEHIELEHGQAVLKEYRLIVQQMLTRVGDSLHLPKLSAGYWGQANADQWYASLNLEEPASNDLDFWKFCADSAIMKSLSPYQVPKALAVWRNLKNVYDGYRDLDDERLVFSYIHGGKLISSNADTAYGDTLVWDFDSKKLQSGGPYTYRASIFVFSPTSTLVLLGILTFILFIRVWRNRAKTRTAS